MNRTLMNMLILGALASCGGDTPPPNTTGVIVFIPEGAHPSVTRASVMQVDETAYPNVADLASPVYEIGPTGTTFSIPVTVAIPIDADTPAGTALEVVRYNETSTSWEPLPGSTIVGTMLVARTDHFSIFAVLGTGAAACDNLWSGGPNTVAPMLVPGAITIAGATRTSEQVFAAGDQFMALGSQWTVDACSADISGNFGPGLTGDGAWTDFTNGGGGAIAQSGAFSLTIDAPAGPELGLADPCNAALDNVAYNLTVNFIADCRIPDGSVMDGSVMDSGVMDSGAMDAGPCAYDPTCGMAPAGMVCIPAGDFTMGDSDMVSVASPERTVCMPTYFIDQTEVTVAAYRDCVDAGACSPAADDGSGVPPNCNWGVAGRDDHPVNCVDWSQASAYCEWAGKRLPTEAEWEKAARGTDGRTFPWGEAEGTCAHATMWRDGAGTECPVTEHSTLPVGNSSPLGDSPYGVMDMTGNVAEYCSDWYVPRYDTADTDNPQGPATGTERARRNNGWRGSTSATYVRRPGVSTADDFSDNDNTGFRCATSG